MRRQLQVVGLCPLLSLLLSSVAVYAQPMVRLGPPARLESRLTPAESDELAAICGMQWSSEKKTKHADDAFPRPPRFIPDGSPRDHYPWAVSIMVDGKNRLGGSLISPYHVLTVAHGFVHFSTYSTRCQFHSYKEMAELRGRDVAYGGECIRGTHPFLPNHARCPRPDMKMNKIRSVLVDDGFQRGNCVLGHDWAIIELEKKVEFTERVRPICLPYLWTPIRSELTVAGWGREYIFNESSPLIREIRMWYAPSCPKPITDLMPAGNLPDLLCAVSKNMSDYWAARTCHGDSGSGMQQLDHQGRARLIALTSFGTMGCPANELARFTKTENYLLEICAQTGVCYPLKKRP